MKHYISKYIKTICYFAALKKKKKTSEGIFIAKMIFKIKML